MTLRKVLYFSYKLYDKRKFSKKAKYFFDNFCIFYELFKLLTKLNHKKYQTISKNSEKFTKNTRHYKDPTKNKKQKFSLLISSK